MNEQNEAPKALTPAEVFRLWADKIEKNDADDFGGVFVIIPPSGEPISGLLIDQEQDLGTFFAVVKSKVESAVDAINDAQRKQGRF